MKKLISMLIPAVMASCASEPEHTADGLPLSTDSAASGIYTAKETPVEANAVRGMYAGSFKAEEYKAKKSYVYRNKITISIDSISGEKIYGHSVVAGNIRPFTGNGKQDKGMLTAEVKEPGDDKYDGTFSFSIDPAAEIVKGTWVAYDAKLPVTKRSYELNKTTFTYNPDATLDGVTGISEADWKDANTLVEESSVEMITMDAMKLNPSAVKLKKEDVENMYKGDLEVMRNGMYARHGYSFKNRKMRYIFDNFVSWYIPTSTDVRKELTALEKENEELIKRYEEHAEKYYDSYGR
jgi:hypothetical protein